MTDRALGRVGGGLGVGGIGGAPVDAGQRGRPVPGHRPDGDTQPGQVRGQGVADLAGPEHDVQPILTHDQVLSTASSNPAVGDSPASTSCHRRYAGPIKQAINFLKCLT